MSKKLNHKDYLSEYQHIEARARALQGQETVRFFRTTAKAISRVFMH